jgi:hypothetical protein
MLAKVIAPWIVVACATSATMTFAASAAAGPLSLKARLLKTGEFPGYRPSGVIVVSTAAAWHDSNRFADVNSCR